MTVAAAPPPRRDPARRLAALLCLMATLGQAGSFLYLPAMPAIAAEFGTGSAAIQGTVTAFLLGACLCYLVYGPLADRHGHRPAFALASALFVAGSLAAALAPDPATLMAARFAQGAGSAAGLVTARGMIRTLIPRGQATQAMALLTATLTLAPGLSPLLGAALLEVAGWRATFHLAAALGLAGLVTGLGVLPGAAAAAPPASAGGAVAAILGTRLFVAALAIAIATNAVFSVLMAASPFVFVEMLGTSPLAYSVVLAGVLAAFSVGATLAGRIAARIGPRRVIGAALVAAHAGAAALLAATVWWPGPAGVGLGLVILLGSFGFVVPNGHVLMLQPFPATAGTAAGLALLITTLTGAGAIALYGATLGGSVAGFGLAMAVFSVLTLVGWRLLPRGEPG